MAVGYSFEASYQTLIEEWNGTSWSVVPSPNIATADASYLTGVWCISSISCMAVGYSFMGPSNFSTLAESWDGTTWSVIPTSASGVLDGVSCVNAGSCVAVGYGATDSLIESWDGTNWSVVPSPNLGSAGGDQNGLFGVSCISSDSCIATGQFYDAAAQTNTAFLESWDGNVWSIVSSPQLTDSSSLNDVSCLPSTSCTAVGVNFDQTLVETGNAVKTSTTVAFASDGGAVVSSISGPDGGLITLPSDTWPGHVFEGWFTARTGGTKAGNAGWYYSIPGGGITLYARWA
jgi:hypothetical protein